MRVFFGDVPGATLGRARRSRSVRDDSDMVRDILISLSGKLREGTRLPKDGGQYPNPDSFADYKPDKKTCRAPTNAY